MPSLFRLFAAFLHSRNVHGRCMALPSSARDGLNIAQDRPEATHRCSNRACPPRPVLATSCRRTGLDKCESQIDAEAYIETLPTAMNAFGLFRTVLCGTLSKLILSCPASTG